VTDLVQQRSMLVILLAACTAAQTVFQAADNAIDTELRVDLDKMIARTETELVKLNRLIDDAAA
jgi:hypothetical protein